MDPATDEDIAQVGDCDRTMLEEAISAADLAFPQHAHDYRHADPLRRLEAIWPGREGSRHYLQEFMELKYVCFAGLAA